LASTANNPGVPTATAAAAWRGAYGCSRLKYSCYALLESVGQARCARRSGRKEKLIAMGYTLVGYT
jgi:hypothetical protein